jgi:hypothetical protein
MKTFLCFASLEFGLTVFAWLEAVVYGLFAAFYPPYLMNYYYNEGTVGLLLGEKD